MDITIHKLVKIIGICLVSFLLCSCSALSLDTSTPTLPLPTGTPTQVSTVTPTTVWFPPTATNTPFPTPIVTPTADLRPAIGSLLFKDDFTSHNAWTLTQTDLGSVAFGKAELTIAIGEKNAYLYSVLEEPTFTDYYLEITAAPSLCKEQDEYGVLFIVSSVDDYYRFSLSCNGQVRLDRIFGAQVSSPQPWMMSGDVPPGAPSSSRLGISAIGNKLSFFINGQFQFSAIGPRLTSGKVGIFARSTNNMAVTINFSDLEIYQINP